MALVFQKNPIHSIFSFKNLLFSLGVLFMAVVSKCYVPVAFELSVSGLPRLWSALMSWFTPPYLYVLVNFIIIAIAASSRFQQKTDEEASSMVVPMKIQPDSHKDAYDAAGKNSVEYRTDIQGNEQEVYGNIESKKLEVQTKEKLKELEVSKRKKPVQATPKEHSYREAKSLEVKKTKKPLESKSKFEVTEATDVEVKTKKKPCESQVEFEGIEGKNLEVHSKMEGEDDYTQSKSMEIPIRMNTVEIPIRMNTVEIPMEYSYSEENGLVSHRHAHPKLEEESLQAGKEEEAVENDTLDGTWKMIMESRRIHNAGLQETSKKEAKYRKSNNLPSPSPSPDTFNW